MPNFLKKMLKSTSVAAEKEDKFLSYSGLAHMVGKLVKVDNTLTKSGQAADAKVVGDKIKNISSVKRYVLHTGSEISFGTQALINQTYSVDQFDYFEFTINFQSQYFTFKFKSQKDPAKRYGFSFTSYNTTDSQIRTVGASFTVNGRYLRNQKARFMYESNDPLDLDLSLIKIVEIAAYKYE